MIWGQMRGVAEALVLETEEGREEGSSTVARLQSKTAMQCADYTPY